MYKATVLLLVVAVLAVGIAWRLQHRSSGPTPTAAATATTVSAASGDAEPGPAASASSTKPTPEFPAVLDLGMGKCIPCKEMKPMLDALAEEYQGRCRIEIIDIGDHPDEAGKHRIQLIPTQIFFDEGGKEVYRHEGFMPREDIVGKLREMGVE